MHPIQSNAEVDLAEKKLPKEVFAEEVLKTYSSVSHLPVFQIFHARLPRVLGALAHGRVREAWGRLGLPLSLVLS